MAEPAWRQRANHKLACSWRLPATNKKFNFLLVSDSAANNRLTIGRYGSLSTTSGGSRRLFFRLCQDLFNFSGDGFTQRGVAVGI